MYWEAFIVILVFTLVLGLVLYIPARILIRHKLASVPTETQKLKLTKLGWILLIITIIILLGGFSFQYIAPQSYLGRLVDTTFGRFLYLVAVLFVFWVIEQILKLGGYKLKK